MKWCAPYCLQSTLVKQSSNIQAEKQPLFGFNTQTFEKFGLILTLQQEVRGMAHISDKGLPALPTKLLSEWIVPYCKEC